MHIVVTMAGHSRRFAAAGLKGPKWLLPVGGRPMIAAVIDMFSQNDTFHFVLNREQIENDPTIRTALEGLANHTHIHVIEPHELGPTFTALQASGIADDEPVIVTYCDFTVQWDYDVFLRHIHGADGAVVSFRGFHPASFGSTYYAYMRVEGDRMLELREKKSFTDDRANEPASAGIYYFGSWALFRRYGEKLLAGENRELPEAYVSLLFNPMVTDHLNVVVHDVERFVCLGTPEDYAQHEFWWTYFHSEQAPCPEPPGVRTTNLVPMAGRGSRFRDYGYRVAKPLIQVRGKPMVLRTLASLPDSGHWIFLPRAQDLERHPIERALRQFAPKCLIIPVDHDTSGQAATCLLATEYLDANDGLLITSSDYEHRYNAEKWTDILSDPSIDGAIWTYRMGAGLVKNPMAFAYCRTDNDGRVLEVVEKRTISDHPEADPLVVGTFWYRHAKDFLWAAHRMIDLGITVNGEHYVGTSINQLLEAGKRFVVFDIEQWISFGDPFELKVLEFWEGYFTDRKTDESATNA